MTRRRKNRRLAKTTKKPKGQKEKSLKSRSKKTKASEMTPDSSVSDSEKPRRPRKKKTPADPVYLLSEMKDLEKRLRATVGGTNCPETEFKWMIKHLKTVCPGPKMCKVVITRKDPEEMESEYGSTTKEKNVFYIEISKALNEYETTHVLLHEWAHMLSWRPYHPLMGDHGSDWGVWYAMVWRKFHGIE